MRPTQLASLAAVTALAGLTVTSPLYAQANCGPTTGEIRVGVAPPPPLPQYAQPPIPAYGDVWTPGYWAWNGAANDYYWVGGVWAAPPAIGLLWTPGFWGWNAGTYVFRPGFWGPHVGFYGGVAYGFGYWGHGYDGGYWRGRTFFYNRVYNNFGAVRINAVYDRRVAYDRAVGRISFNGGPGGVRAAPTGEELAAARESHIVATAAQTQHIQAAAADGQLRAGVNHGHPALPPPAAHAASVAAHTVSHVHAIASSHLHAAVAAHAHSVAHARHAGSGSVAHYHVGSTHAASSRPYDRGMRTHSPHAEAARAHEARNAGTGTHRGGHGF